MRIFYLMHLLPTVTWNQCDSSRFEKDSAEHENVQVETHSVGQFGNETFFGDFYHTLINDDNLMRKRRDSDDQNQRTSGAKQEADQKCLNEGPDSSLVCDPILGGVCRNRTCVSSCVNKRLRKCNCSDPDDNYCYLCCGNSTNTCKPAHQYNIYQPNGELWERTSCARCRHRATDGLSCDDRDKKRVCYSGKCASNACLGRPEGVYCDARKSKVCSDSQCQDPCSAHRADLLTCECDLYSDYRCELCCFDPSRKRCESAFKKYAIRNAVNRPIARSGVNCRYGPRCNFFAVCSKASAIHQPQLPFLFPSSLTLLLFLIVYL